MTARERAIKLVNIVLDAPHAPHVVLIQVATGAIEAAILEEREACALAADSVRNRLAIWKDFEIAEQIAEDIRKRGQS